VDLIHGTGDETVPVDASGRRSAQLLPNAVSIEYDGEPHGLFLTLADQLNADLLEFIGTARPATVGPALGLM
jgi:non-heme chloroperoxidase